MTLVKWKIEVVSGVISSTESESEESECFHFFRFRLRLRRLYDLVKTRLLESEAEAEEPANRYVYSNFSWPILSKGERCNEVNPI